MPLLTLFCSFPGFPFVTLFFELFHKSGSSGVANAETALAVLEATRSSV